jgi:hypothetical protein
VDEKKLPIDELELAIAHLISDMSNEEIIEFQQTLKMLFDVIDNLNDMQKWLDKYGL